MESFLMILVGCVLIALGVFWVPFPQNTIVSFVGGGMVGFAVVTRGRY